MQLHNFVMLGNMTFLLPSGPGRAGTPNPEFLQTLELGWAGWCLGEGSLLTQGRGGTGALGRFPTLRTCPPGEDSLPGLTSYAHLMEKLNEWPRSLPWRDPSQGVRGEAAVGRSLDKLPPGVTSPSA